MMKCERCNEREATHVLLGLEPKEVCGCCYDQMMASTPPRPEPRYFLGDANGALHEVDYATWKLQGN